LARAASDSRYRFAKEHVEGRRILEAGCGARDGSSSFSELADIVLAVDISEKGVSLASRSTLGDDRIHFGVMDCQQLGLSGSCFDTVVSLEVIEHLPDPQSHILEVARVLKSSGVYIGSTPNRARQGYRPNPHHIKELTAEEYRGLLETAFEQVSLFGQSPSPEVEGRGEALRRAIARIDVLRVRRFIPQWMKDSINSTFFRLKSAWLVGPGEWRIDPEQRSEARSVERATVICCVCRKPKEAKS
jgi:ubiquinone/menaquinone biosynthesis C-methylase UbiE